MPSSIANRIDAGRELVIELQKKLVSIPAIGPDNGGPGEWAKFEFAESWLKELGLEITRMDAPDPRADPPVRPNLAARLPGENRDRVLWIIAHLDVVPPGDLSLWTSDPYQLKVDGDTLVGRGVEDNHQAFVSSALLAKALLDEGVTPPIDLGILAVSDEETGSHFGLDYVAREHPETFGPDDLFLIPDFGAPDSGIIEVAEKSMFWLKVTVTGKQCHASEPQLGINTLTASADLIVRLKSLYTTFDGNDPMFSPSCSTFEPTKKEANVENINTVPGRDVFYVDSRVLPDYPLSDVLDEIKRLGSDVESEYGVTIEYESVLWEQAAEPTDPESEVVVRLSEAVKQIYGVTPKPTGIGGGTVAAMLRRRGHPAAVWATLGHAAHQPNEYSSIAATIKDALVMARVLMGMGG